MTFPASEGGEAARIRARLAGLAEERAALEARLAELGDAPSAGPDGDPAGSPVTDRSPSDAKIALFHSLFAGREDVFPRRWENARTGKAGYAVDQAAGSASETDASTPVPAIHVRIGRADRSTVARRSTM